MIVIILNIINLHKLIHIYFIVINLIPNIKLNDNLNVK